MVDMIAAITAAMASAHTRSGRAFIATTKKTLLSLTPYAAAADALRSSMAAFETWCDDAVIDALAGAKTKPFGPEPLAAYVLGKENEIKTVRIILSARHNGLPDDAVRARIRTLY